MLFTIALLQLESAGLDREANLRSGLDACLKAKALGADLALFPELWSTGYEFSQDMAALAIDEDSDFIRAFAAEAARLGLAIGLTYLGHGLKAPRNSFILFDRRGRTVLRYDKVHCCSFSLEECLEAGTDFPVCDLDCAEARVRLGAMICFDREFPESARVLALRGAEIILVPNACQLEDHRLQQLRTRAFENMVGIACANYPEPKANGHSIALHPMAFDKDGLSRELCIVEAGPNPGIILARFDIDAIREYRSREVWGSAYRKPEAYGPLLDPLLKK